MPIVNGPSLPRGEVEWSVGLFCSPDGYVGGRAFARNTSETYFVDWKVEILGWTIGSGRLMPGEYQPVEVISELTSIPAAVATVTFTWENGEVQFFEEAFEALDCTPEEWVVVHLERDPWVWSTKLDKLFNPMWFQPPTEELRLVSIPLGRQEALRAHGHLIEYLVVEWYDQQYVQVVFVDGVEVETVTGEIAEIILRDENGIIVLAVFVGEGCGQNLCQNPMVWYRTDPAATGLLVDIANEW